MNALLIIDYQRAVFLGQPAHLVFEVAGVLAASALKARDLGWKVVFIRHEDPGTDWDRSSLGWLFPDEIRPIPGDEILDKKSCDAFRATRLQELLQQNRIKRLWVGGYATEFCVDTTIRSAASREFQTTVLSDGHTTRSRPEIDAATIIRHHNWVWSNIANPGNPIRVLPSENAFS